MNDPQRFPALCRRLIDANPQDWRARLALARYLTAHGQAAEALELLFDALVINPHALALHQAIWQTLLHLKLAPALVKRYADLAHDAIFYVDPHICVRCRYRSTELHLAVPALPRVEHLRRGTHRAGEGHRGDAYELGESYRLRTVDCGCTNRQSAISDLRIDESQSAVRNQQIRNQQSAFSISWTVLTCASVSLAVPSVLIT